ncbi:MAG TPA: DEAD/DEAH box helicase [Candidatus Nanoarchaeia archaeon]|nr:DEAD/DEAH box helicase [Candidatus Nanoarchaeia archaeon]
MIFENLIEPLQRALKKEAYTEPTPIQVQAIPQLLKGKDMIGIAQTGTGKTAAFVLPILQIMSEKHTVAYPNLPRVLVIAPTRELAVQIGQSFSAYGRFLRFKHTVIFGGVSQLPQVNALSRGIDILIATPGRLLDLMNQGYIKLKDVEFFVLDEADRMLDMGFIHDVRRIVSLLPQKRQSLFFSATMPREVAELANKLLTNPVRVEVTPQATTVEAVEQHVFFVDQANKDALLVTLLLQEHLKCVLVFTRLKHRANKIAMMLTKNNIRADAIHGNKSQSQRSRALNDFKSGHVRVLVATDIAARGIDIDNISHVINYDLPNEPESYVHRIGRTARAGKAGNAFSFCAADERNFLRDIEKLTHVNIEPVTHPYHSEHAKNAIGKMAGAAAKTGRGKQHNSQRHFTHRRKGRSNDWKSNPARPR